jgi:hypothetical protein
LLIVTTKTVQLEGKVNLKIDISSKRKAGSEMALPFFVLKLNLSKNSVLSIVAPRLMALHHGR